MSLDASQASFYAANRVGQQQQVIGELKSMQPLPPAAGAAADADSFSSRQSTLQQHQHQPQSFDSMVSMNPFHSSGGGSSVSMSPMRGQQQHHQQAQQQQPLPLGSDFHPHRPQAKVPYEGWVGGGGGNIGSGGGGGGMSMSHINAREEPERLRRGLMELEEGIRGAAQQLCQVRQAASFPWCASS